ncbi:transposase [Streptomyces sp. NBC_00056]|uniref:zinc ribbon domain-containing protein n=1 Tax=Streptomyces sp. NBC_00056 TaxID=2975633 RepID=UPI00324682DB
MKLVVQVKLLPTPEQAAALEATLRVCNRAATHVASVAFDTGVKDRNGLQKLLYTDIKATFGLSAQPAVRVVKKVVDAYAALAAQARAGLLGKATSKRYRRAMSSPVSFRPEAAQPFDDRCLSWQQDVRDRVRLRRDQRGTLSSWPFHQLGRHLAYKARQTGVAFLEVDAAHTSQRCPRCGHTEKANRPAREHFRCRRCGLAGPADVVAGVNVRDRARSAWVFVTMPVPATAAQPEAKGRCDP